MDQRRRIQAGTAGAVSRHGYAHATVAQIIDAAGVSRRTFYELYPDKQAAFFAAHEEGLAFALAPYLEPAGGRDDADGLPSAGQRGENCLPSPLTHI